MPNSGSSAPPPAPPLPSFCRSGGIGGGAEGGEGSIAPPLCPQILKELEETHVYQDTFLLLLDPQIFRLSDGSVWYLFSLFICLVFCSLFGFVNLELTSNSHYIFTTLQPNDINENYRVFFVLKISLILMRVLIFT